MGAFLAQGSHLHTFETKCWYYNERQGGKQLLKVLLGQNEILFNEQIMNPMFYHLTEEI